MMQRSAGMTSEMRMEEIWKPIDGYESYLVSSFGRIYSKKSNRLLKPSKANNGYMGIELFNKKAGANGKNSIKTGKPAVLNSSLSEARHRQATSLSGAATVFFCPRITRV